MYLRRIPYKFEYIFIDKHEYVVLINNNIRIVV